MLGLQDANSPENCACAQDLANIGRVIGFSQHRPIRIPVALRAQASVLHHLLDLIRFRL